MNPFLIYKYIQQGGSNRDGTYINKCVYFISDILPHHNVKINGIFFCVLIPQPHSHPPKKITNKNYKRYLVSEANTDVMIYPTRIVLLYNGPFLSIIYPLHRVLSHQILAHKYKYRTSSVIGYRLLCPLFVHSIKQRKGHEEVRLGYVRFCGLFSSYRVYKKRT